jgi:hypothetical protein
MNQISITKIKSSLPIPSPLLGEGNGEGRLAHLEIGGLGFVWDLGIGIWDFDQSV